MLQQVQSYDCTPQRRATSAVAASAVISSCSYVEISNREFRQALECFDYSLHIFVLLPNLLAVVFGRFQLGGAEEPSTLYVDLGVRIVHFLESFIDKFQKAVELVN